MIYSLQVELPSDNVVITMFTLQEFGWVLNLQKFVLPMTRRLEYLGLILEGVPSTRQTYGSSGCSVVAAVLQVVVCMQVLVLMVSTFFRQFHMPIFRLESCRRRSYPCGTDLRHPWTTRFS